MKKTYIIWVLLGCISILSAQNPQWKDWGVPAKIPDWTGDYEVRSIPKADGGFYEVRIKFDIKVFQTRLEADEYSPQLERIKTLSLTPLYNYVGFLSYVDFHKIGDRYYMFLDNFVKEEQKAFLYVQEVSMNSGRLLDEPREIAQMAAPSNIRAGEYEIAFSPDGSKILVTQNESPIKKENEKISFRVFDNQFNELSFQTHELPYPGKIATRNTPMITDDGRIYFFKEAKPLKGPRFLTFFASVAKGKPLVESTPYLGVNAVGAYRGMLDDQQRPILIGYYEPSAKSKLVQSSAPQPYGIFFIQYDKNGSEQDVKLNEFSDFSNTQKGINNCKLQDIYAYEGGYLVAGEWRDESLTTANGASLDNGPITYKARKGYLSFLDKEGQMQGLLVEIDKNNESVNDGGRHNSFLVFEQGGQIHLLFNDFTYKYDGSNRAGANPFRAPIMQVFDSKGTLLQTAIFDNMGVGGRLDEFHLCTDGILQMEDGSLLVRGASRVEQKFGRLIMP